MILKHSKTIRSAISLLWVQTELGIKWSLVQEFKKSYSRDITLLIVLL